ncbi:MAG: AraC family transcriptional regulator [Spirochaetota bacterium]
MVGSVAEHDEQRPTKDLYEPRVRFDDVAEEAPSGLPYHYHDCYEIFCSRVDRLAYRVNGALYRLGFGDILVFNQFDVHQSLAEPGSDYRRHVTIFHPELIAPWSTPDYDLLRCFERRPAGFTHLIRLAAPDLQRYDELFTRGLAARTLEPPERDMVRRLVLAELLVVVNRGTPLEPADRSQPAASPDDNARLEEITRYVDEHLADDLSLDRIADRFATTPNGLNRLCRRAGRITLHQYIVRRRIERARLVLARGTTVTEAAYAAGFGSLSHFIRTFRSKTGASPKEYQRRILERVRADRSALNSG